ncbi:hypothetical protein Btru_025264 [Bulinus truncatus]|nr:hypothetical protein Btru_025264 [Bulinus truncatus]
MGSLFSSWRHCTRARCRYNIVVAAVLLSFIHFSGAIQSWCSRKENSGPNFTSSQAPEVSSSPQDYTADNALSRGTTLFQGELTTSPSISLWGGDAGVSDSFYDAANVSAKGDVIDANATSLWDHSSGAFNTTSPSSSPPANNNDVPTASNPFSGSRGQVEVVWDASVVSATDYVHSYCPRRCRDGEVVFISDVEQKCPDYLCFPCECARPSCELYGICCPDITEPYNPLPGLQNNYSALFSSPAPLTGPETLAASVERSATLPVLMCDDLSSDEVTFLYIGSCQLGFQDDKGTVTLCEAELDETDFSPQAFTRAADPVNNVVYRNVYCALCNGVEKSVPFLLSVECLDYMSIYTASNQGEMIQLASEPHSGCRVEQLVPAGVSTVRCDPDFFGHAAVDRCDSPIASWTDDRNVSRACAVFNGSVNVVLSPYSGNLYKNLFCGICHVVSERSFFRLLSCIISYLQRAGPQRAGPQRAGPQRTGPQRAGPQRAWPQRAGPQRAWPQRADHKEQGHKGLDHKWLGHKELGHNKLGHKGLGHKELGHKGMDHKGLGQKGLGQKGLGHKKLGHKKLGHKKLGHKELGHKGLGHKELGHKELGHKELGHKGLDHRGLGHKELDHKWLGHKELGHKELGHNKLGHKGLGHKELGHKGMDHKGLGQKGLGHKKLGHKKLGHKGLGHKELGHKGQS